jgi:D-beta-D-heptose 7-phosphate kinase/D-beta-D-heptose 1-phosphate adenosyltransferase
MTELATTQQQKQSKILLVGDTGIDIYQYGSVDRISPEAPVPVFKHSHAKDKPGMASNVYTNLQALGCDVTHKFGQYPCVKTRLIDIRSRQQIVRIDNDVTSPTLRFEKFKETYDAVIISDYDKGAISYDTIDDLRKLRIPIFIDTKKTDLARLEGCIIKINALEMSRAISMPSSQTILIITQGDKGVTWGTRNFPAKLVEVADVCGAGDTFLSALAYKYLETDNMPTAINFAIAASAVTVQHVGVYSPTLEEIL